MQSVASALMEGCYWYGRRLPVDCGACPFWQPEEFCFLSIPRQLWPEAYTERMQSMTQAEIMGHYDNLSLALTDSGYTEYGAAMALITATNRKNFNRWS